MATKGKPSPWKGKHPSLESLKKMRESHLGQVSWNKGKKGVYSEETRRKMSEAKKGFIPWIKGKHHTPETIARFSASLKGRIPWNKGKKTGISPWKGKITLNKGAYHTEEAKRKMSIASLKSWSNPEYRKHMREVHIGHIPWNKGKSYPNPKLKGHTVSEETKRKISEAHKGKPAWWKIGKHPSKETRIKISLAAKGRAPPNKGIPMREESRKKLSESLKGHISWNKGKTGVFSEETIRKMSLAKIGKPSPKKGTHPSKETIEKQKKSWMTTFLTNPEVRKKMSYSGHIAWSTPEKKKFARERRLKQVFPMKDSQPEVKIQKELIKRGITFQKHKAIIGQPDIFIEPNICVFCDGDYWHAKPNIYSENKIIRRGKTAKQIWEKDKEVNNELKNRGFNVLRFWESDINKNVSKCVDKVEEALKKRFN